MNRRSLLKGFAVGAASVVFAPVLRRSLFAADSSPLTSEGAVVETSYGKVRSYREGASLIFKGIPYGADTAPTRFMAPLPPAAWSGIRDAFKLGPRVPQPERAQGSLASGLPPQEPVSEDCLYLNVWTPGANPQAKRPVMVYIQGRVSRRI